MDEPLSGLAAAAVRGDSAALEELIRLTQRDVWVLCAHLVDRQSADDLTQETYLRAFRSLHRFRGESSVRTWLLVIARRTCHDELRARDRRQRRDQRLVREFGQEPADADPAGHLTLYAMVSVLEPHRRAAFVLTQLFGMSYAEAAGVCECSIGTIRSRVARAREELISSLATEDSGFRVRDGERRSL
jgi:RNA polymerase sigma-70 factor, ECF subfamily